MIPVLAQIVQRYLPGHKIEELAKDEVVKAREFSYSAQVYLLMLGQLAHVFSLNELVDLSSIFSGELRRIRGIESVELLFRPNKYAGWTPVWLFPHLSQRLPTVESVNSVFVFEFRPSVLEFRARDTYAVFLHLAERTIVRAPSINLKGYAVA